MNQEELRSRCKDCSSLTEREGKWWCDEGDCAIDNILQCEWWNKEVDYDRIQTS